MKPRGRKVTRSSAAENEIIKRRLSEDERSEQADQEQRRETRRGKRLAPAGKVKQESSNFAEKLTSPPPEDYEMLNSGWAEGEVAVVRSRQRQLRNGTSVMVKEEREYRGDCSTRSLHYEVVAEESQLISNLKDLSEVKEAVKRCLRTAKATTVGEEESEGDEVPVLKPRGQHVDAKSEPKGVTQEKGQLEEDEDEGGLTLKPLRMENPCYAMCLQRMEELSHELPQLKSFLDEKEKTADVVKQMSDEINQDYVDGKLEEVDDAKKEEWKNKLQECLTATEEEEQRIRAALEKVYQIRTLREEARSIHKVGNVDMLRRGALMIILHEAGKHIPLYIGEYGQKAPPLVGRIPAAASHVAEPKEIVAALVKSEDDGEDNWILAEVVSYNAEQKAYSVRDVDEEEKEEHMVSKDKTVPLPRYRADPDFYADALYAEGEIVYALYPQTTCFYRAKITYKPKHPEEEYELVFEDSMYSSGYSPPMSVPQRYVISIPTTVKHTVSSRRARAQMRLAESPNK